MPDMNKILRKSKVIYDPFMDFVNDCTLKEFLSTFRSPFLVGQDLYQGDMMEKTIQEYNPTFRFVGGEIPAVDPTRTINRHIFYLNAPDIIINDTRYNIGRTSNNDIVVVDYSISKQHAIIVKRNNRFYVVDQGATNGTTLNGSKLKPEVEHSIRANDLIAFGRLGFVFMSPMRLFRICRVYSGLESTLDTEFLGILKYIRTPALEKIAAQINVQTEGLSKSDVVRAILRHLTPGQILERLF